MSDSRTIVLIIDGPPSRTVEVVILAALQRPEKGDKPQSAEKEGDRNEINQHVHARRAPPGMGVDAADMVSFRSAPTSLFSRSAFTTTMMDEVDMATAAIRGVA